MSREQLRSAGQNMIGSLPTSAPPQIIKDEREEQVAPSSRPLFNANPNVIDSITGSAHLSFVATDYPTFVSGPTFSPHHLCSVKKNITKI